MRHRRRPGVQDGPFTVTEPYVTRMRDTMVHRGPDGGETWVADDGRVGLGHRRLSIIDLSTAREPADEQRGRLDLDRLQRRDLQPRRDPRRARGSSAGTRWKTDHSDTEVIIHAFEEWGIDCLHRFRGMFGIALWDGRTRELWLVRDRIGIKPLYYSIHDGRITFASEIKALLADPDQSASVDEEALFHYLSFLTTPAPMTLFEGIRKLPGATWMRVAEDGTMRRGALLGRLGDARGPLGDMRRGRHRDAAPRRAAHRREVPQGERRARRRLPLGRHRLQHQRRALLRRRGRSRSRPSPSATRASTRRYQNELALRPADGRGRGRRASRAAAHAEGPHRLPAEMV